MKVFIYRVEMPRGGCGPYVGANTVLKEMHAAHAGNRPAPEDDAGLGSIRADEFCGFATMDALDRWFAGYHKLLAECGYVIAVYSMPITHVRYGKRQALFRRGDNFPVETMPLNHAVSPALSFATMPMPIITMP
jgi:hypothetical protein